MPSEEGLVTLEEIKSAQKTIMECPLGVHKTPLLQGMSQYFPEIDQSMDLYLKLESMQTTGSFKLRGVANQMSNLPEEVKSGQKRLITMSAGNYGKAFAYTLSKLNLSGLCLMPLTAPSSRVSLIKKYGINVEQSTNAELSKIVDNYVQKEGYIYFHPFDDLSLIAGYGSFDCEVEVLPSNEIQTAIKHYIDQNCHFIHSYDDKKFIQGCGSAGLEIVEDGVRPDVVVVCCGGGGLVSGVAAAIKQSGHDDCRIYAVEPEGSRTMFESFKKGEPVSMNVNSIATGLSPPFAGKITYQHCKKFLEDVILVTDQEILRCMKKLYDIGLVAEPSGCAAMAAILNGKIPDISGKKVVVYITGSNVTLSEMTSYLQ